RPRPLAARHPRRYRRLRPARSSSRSRWSRSGATQPRGRWPAGCQALRSHIGEESSNSLSLGGTDPDGDGTTRPEKRQTGSVASLQAMSGFAAAHLSEIEEITDGRCPWRPVRHHFGIQSFGINAWTAAKVGDRIINEHGEADQGEQQEELYLVT